MSLDLGWVVELELGKIWFNISFFDKFFLLFDFILIKIVILRLEIWEDEWFIFYLRDI